MIFLVDPRIRLVVRSTYGPAKDTPANWIAPERALPLKASSSKNWPLVPTNLEGSPAPQRKTPVAAQRRAVFLAARPRFVAHQAAEVLPCQTPRGRMLARSKKPLNWALNGSGAPTPHRLAAWGEIFKTNRTP
jgi:hypothetical protein